MNTPSTARSPITPWSHQITIDGASEALHAQRYETARRIAVAVLAQDLQEGERISATVVLHDALMHLGELPRAMALLDGMDGGFAVALRRFVDLRRAAAFSFYRVSPEKSRGLSYEEFSADLTVRRVAAAEHLLAIIATPEQAGEARQALVDTVSDAERSTPTEAQLLARLNGQWPAPGPTTVPALVAVRLSGRLRFHGAVPSATVTLGVEAPVGRIHPTAVDSRVIGVPEPLIGAITTLVAALASDGTFVITGEVPPGNGFLAITSATIEGIPTRFIARDLPIDGSSPLPPLDLTVGEWRSAPVEVFVDPLPAVIDHAGRRWRKQAVEELRNPFWHDFPRQDLRLPWSAPAAGSAAMVWCDGAPLAHQRDAQERVLCFTDLPRRSVRHLGWYHAVGGMPAAATSLLTVESGGRTAVLDTGRSSFRIPWGLAAEGAAPILAVMGPDRRWRGRGQWQTVGRPPEQTVAVLSDGALEAVVEITYRFATGQRCVFTLTAHAGEEYLLVAERGEALADTAFVFGLEDFRGGRGYLHWTAEGEAAHWHDLIDADRELARIQESVPWWIPPAGFAWAATRDGLAEHDVVAVYSRTRGQWIDHEFAAIAGGPPPGGHELDWPYPEMVGSTISMITVASTADGQLGIRFPRFAGERQWGLLASDLARGDGPLKELQQVRHKTSFPRIDDLRRWTLDEPDRQARPCLLVERERLPDIRARLADPAVAPLWARLRSGKGPGSLAAMEFAINGDPVIGWRLGRRLAQVLPTQARCLLLSRENGDVWSPVGGRCWAPQSESYDAVLGSGALSAAEEREARACLLLAGQMFASPELMNWRYGGRNANFEADRVEALGSIGLCFPGNPSAEPLVDHAVERLGAALTAYCTPGSGKWYENPACYYLQSLRSRLALACHLASRGRLELAAVPRISDFAGWLLQMLTPRLPAASDVLRDGCSHAGYATVQKVRRIAPYGDHAHLGPWVPDIAVIAAHQLQPAFPALAGALRWAWHEGGRDGSYFGSLPLLVSHMTPAALAPDTGPAPLLPSRRLEGFGAVFRGNQGRDDEFMLLAKLGPGGYRYHRSEGSFILIADGRPLVYDGGEGGEAWRHSGITYHAEQVASSPGRIERFASLPTVDFAQGLHPVTPKPGDPTFLSDVCEHQLVEEAKRRARIERPAAARAWLWIKGGYVVLWDRLDVADDVMHHWNLQVMAHDEVGDPAAGLRFRGRFGTDLQVLLPAGGDQPWSVAQLPMHEYRIPAEQCVAQRHLKIAGRGPSDRLAILRPLPPGAAPVVSTPLLALGRTVGARITGEGIDDRVVVGRVPCAVSDDAWSFAGAAGGLLRRPGAITLLLLGAGRISAGDAVLESDGPAAELQITPDGGSLHQDGAGTVLATIAGRRILTH